MVIVADCTYNPDVVPHLVATLEGIAEASKGVLVLVAMKVRHESELVFFELMANACFIIEGKIIVPLPVLEGEGEEIEIFGFKLE